MKSIIKLLCAIAPLITMHQVEAQSLPPAVSLRLGIVQPGAGSTRTVTGQYPVYIGIDYEPRGTDGMARSDYYADYIDGSRRGGHVRMFGVGAASIASGQPGGMSKTTPFGGAGVGIYHLDVKDSSRGVDASKTTFGGKLFIGYHFAARVDFELAYQFIPSYQGVNPSGFSLQVGFPI